MDNVIGQFLLGLIPHENDDPMKVYVWRWKSVILGAISLVIATYAAGFIPFLQPPYALAETVTKNAVEIKTRFDGMSGQVSELRGQMKVVIDQQRDAQVHGVNNDLIDARRYQCRAVISADKSALPFWNNRVQTLKLQYQQITGEAWPDMNCNSF